MHTNPYLHHVLILTLLLILSPTSTAQTTQDTPSCTDATSQKCTQNADYAFPVWMDCDPGLDDTIAIIYAAKSDRIKLLGISTSQGNSNLKSTTKNTLDILHNIDRSDIPVIRGSDKPIHGQSKTAQQIHGQGGLGGVIIPSSKKQAIIQNNFKAIRDTIMNSEDKVIWANTGALTNLCILLEQYPQIKDKLLKIVIMGGAIGRGNMTPAAQFNILFDPVAYDRVLKNKGSIPLVMIPLQVTHQVKAKQPIFQFLHRHSQIPFAKAIYNMLNSFKQMYKKYQNFDHPPIHDACVINYILHPQNFQLKKALIVVDTGAISYGRTNCYFSDPKDALKQVDSIDYVAVKMNKRAMFWETMEEIFLEIFTNPKYDTLA